MKRTKGITLIALVITIIVLLILAGITIGTLTGENGIIQKAKEAALETRGASVEEAKQMWELEKQLGTGKELSGLLDELEDQGLLIDGERAIIEETGEITIGSRTIVFIKPDTASIKIKVNTGDDGQVVLPITYANGDNFKVDWGDGKIENYPNTSAEIIKSKTKVASIENIELAVAKYIGIPHLYEEKNVEKIVTISGKVGAIDSYYEQVTIDKIIEIVQWGETGLEQVKLSECYNLTKIASPTENSFKNITRFGDVFEYCESLENIPEDLFANCPNVTEFYRTFSGCTSLEIIPENLFANCPNVESFEGTFSGCTSLEIIPENLFANCPNVESFAYTFSGCTSLERIPENLFTNCPNVTEFSDTFSGCTNLKGNAIPLWERVEGYEELDFENDVEWWGTIPDGDGCYADCEGLNDYENIPAYWKRVINPE